MKHFIEVFGKSIVFLTLVVISILAMWFIITFLLGLVVEEESFVIFLDDLVLFFLIIFGWVPAIVAMDKLYGED